MNNPCLSKLERRVLLALAVVLLASAPAHAYIGPGAGFAAPSGGNPNGPWEANAKAYAAGALYASAMDMFRFNNALYDGTFVKPETMRLMHTPHNGPVGLGFFASAQRVSHHGVIPGFTARFYSYPSTKGLVMVLSNGATSAPSLADRLVSLLNQ